MTIDRARAAEAIDTFLRALGRDPSTERDLIGTSHRVAAAFADEICEGYAVDVDALLQAEVISSERERTQIVVLRDIAVGTTCPHHLMPATGTATVAFEAREKVLGLGSIARLVDAYAHRLTLQETIGQEVTEALMKHVSPAWAACRLVLSHGCIVARGERRHGTRVETLAMAGDISDATRAWLLGPMVVPG